MKIDIFIHFLLQNTFNSLTPNMRSTKNIFGLPINMVYRNINCSIVCGLPMFYIKKIKKTNVFYEK